MDPGLPEQPATRTRPGGYDFWVAALDNGVALADVLVHISESDENQAALVGIISAGFDNTPFP